MGKEGEDDRSKDRIGDRSILGGKDRSKDRTGDRSIFEKPLIHEPPRKEVDLPEQEFEEQQVQIEQQSTEHIALQDQVTSYGQQLRYERKLRGWTEEQLAEKIGVSPKQVKEWETNRRDLDSASRRELSKILGNAYYLSSETPDKRTLKVRIVQRQLIAQDFTTIISVLTEFHTQFWLIQQGRFADLAKYTETQDRHFVKEANLVIDNLTSNSPALLTLLTDPGTATTAVAEAVTLAVALQKVVDVIMQTWGKFQERKQKQFEMEQKRLEEQFEMQQKQFEMQQKQLEAERKQFEWEQQQLDRIVGFANTLHPGIDEQTREEIMQAMKLTYWKYIEREWLEFTLPASHNG